MLHQLVFTKASGAGNDFVVIDNMQGLYRHDWSRTAVAFCSRHFGIGADGLLVLEPSGHTDFTMLYFNADGSYGGMCGNGGRCAARFAYQRGYARETMTFTAINHAYRARIIGNEVQLVMKDPVQFRDDILVGREPLLSGVHFLDTGSPHVVIFRNEIEQADVEGLGRSLRHAPEFSPEGANVNVVALRDHGLELRTYERGVERETLACGTGSVASAITAARIAGYTSPVHVHVRSGEILRVSFRRDGDRFTDVCLEGSARMLFDGACLYDDESGALVAPGAGQPSHA